ncbi:hypothetical protein HDU93_000722 [Gonapodya sp. JEL0774]|nr:hypothetical protein HDU93_000722 [Gonapodya sp. JEL0774]
MADSKDSQYSKSISLIDTNLGETEDSKNFSLIEAIEKDDEDRVQLLLDQGADPNARKCLNLIMDIGGEHVTETAEGESALAIAIIHGRSAITRTLLERGANPEATVEWPIAKTFPSEISSDAWHSGTTGFARWRSIMSFPSCLALAVAGGGRGNVQMIHPKFGDDDYRFPDKSKIFRKVCLTPRPDIVSHLLSHGAKITYEMREFSRIYIRDKKIYQILYEHYVQELHARFPALNDSEAKDASLIDAVECNDVDKVRQLLRGGASPNARKRIALLGAIEREVMLDTRTCESALALAVIHGLIDVVVALVDGGADVKESVAWSVPNSENYWTSSSWEGRWTIHYTFPNVLYLAVGRRGTQQRYHRYGSKPSDAYYNLSFNDKGGYITRVNPEPRKRSSLELQGNLDIIKFLLAHGCGEGLPQQYILEVMQAVVDVPISSNSTLRYNAGDEIFVVSVSDDLKYGYGFSVAKKRFGSFPLKTLHKWADTGSEREEKSHSAISHAAEADLAVDGVPAWQMDHTGISLGVKLGEGSFGVVYKCQWAAVDAAVKYLKVEEGDAREAFKAAFIREVSVWHAVGYHPNIVPLIGASWDAPRPLMLSPFMKNGNILEYMAACRARNVRIDKFQLLHDIAAGMYYLHKIRGIVHADLKPQNVLVDDKGSSRVADFGTSKILDLPTEGSTGYRPGTALYMPPERLSGGGATKEGDVYAFAITAFRISGQNQIWTERLPFEESGLTDIALYRTIVEDDYRPTIHESDGMPEQLKKLVEESWDKVPSKRPTFESITKRLKEMIV